MTEQTTIEIHGSSGSIGISHKDDIIAIATSNEGARLNIQQAHVLLCALSAMLTNGGLHNDQNA